MVIPGPYGARESTENGRWVPGFAMAHLGNAAGGSTWDPGGSNGSGSHQVPWSMVALAEPLNRKNVRFRDCCPHE
jgi:hypothetical protein